jgi:sulfide:quinone oxidoreductase
MGDRHHVVIAGGGVAALEAALALREVASELVTVEIVAPETNFTYRPLAVAEPFRVAELRTFPLAALVEAADASLRVGAATAVVPDRRALLTTAGEVAYDSLLVGVGAKPREAVPGALTFRGAEDVRRVDAILHDAALGRLERIVFALPGGAGWPLPLYELALLTRAELVDRGMTSVEIVLVTPEERPLAVFGAAASEAIADLLEIRGIELRTHETPLHFADGALHVAPDGAVAADCVIALPRLEGPRLEGIAYDAQGFIPTNDHSRVTGEVDVYAAGDATTFPLKQGGVAAQQADAAAAAIAEQAGVDVEPEPFRPVLRGLLLTGMVPRFLRAEAASGRSVADTEPLWWPPAKIVGKHLAPFLAEHLGLSHVFAEPPQGVSVDITLEEAPAPTSST